MVLKRREPRGSLTAGGFTVSVDLYVGGDERSHQPRPHRSLMIGAVSLGWATCVSATVLGIAWRKTSQTVGGQRVFLNIFHHRLCAFRGQHAVRQTDREYLVRTNRSIWWPAVYYVV